MILKNLILVMCVIALLAVVSVLWQSARTEEPPRENLLVFDLTQIGDGGFSVQDCNCQPKAKVLVLWRGEEMSAFLLKSRDGGVVMPDQHKTWAGDYVCRDFAPQAMAPGRLKPNGYIACHDPAAPNAALWRWTLSGRAFNPQVPDLVMLRTERKGQYLHVFR